MAGFAPETLCKDGTLTFPGTAPISRFIPRADRVLRFGKP
jgi:hypothetical protein